MSDSHSSEGDLERTYTVSVTATSEQGLMEAADRLSGACLSIQDYPEVEHVEAQFPEPVDFEVADDE